MVVEGGLYHVYNRFARGAALFDEGDESERFVELLRRVRDRDGLTIFAYCLMSNHYLCAAAHKKWFDMMHQAKTVISSRSTTLFINATNVAASSSSDSSIDPPPSRL